MPIVYTQDRIYYDNFAKWFGAPCYFLEARFIRPEKTWFSAKIRKCEGLRAL